MTDTKPAPERAVFDRWLRDNGHCEDQHDDMLMPLQRSLNGLMWGAWQGAVAAERQRIAAALDAMHEQYSSLHNYYRVLAVMLREDRL